MVIEELAAITRVLVRLTVAYCGGQGKEFSIVRGKATV